MFAALLCILNMRPSLEAGALVLKSQDDLLVPPDSQAVFAVERSDGDEATTTSYYKDYSQVVTNETGGASNGYVATGTQPITDDSDPNVVLPGGITEKSYGECGAEGNNLTWSLDSKGDYSALRKTLIHRKENIDTRQGKHQFAQGTQ